jgi:hypothetical protein
VRLVFESAYCKDVEPEQGLVNYIFRGLFTQGLDSEFFMVHRSQGFGLSINGPCIFQ